MGSTNDGHRTDIDGLRAIAVSLVLFNHLVSVPAGGFVGVDLFFVISGFVITSMIWKDSAAGRFSLPRFFTRRIRRLLPSALLTLGIVNLIVGSLFLGPRIQQTHEDSAWALAFLANVHMADAGANYFSHNNAPSVLQHYWSLAVEEQFYVVWPLVLLALVWLGRRRHIDRLVLPIVIAATAASFTYALHAVAVEPERAYFSTPARAWELGVGATIGLLVQWGLAPPDWVRRLFAWGGLGLLVIACTLIDPTKPFPGMAALVPVSAGALFLLSGGGARPSMITRGLSSSIPRYLGSISYPIYLWHWPVIVIAEEVWGRNALIYVIAPVMSVALAVITHHLVEEPLRGRLPIREAYRALKPVLQGNGSQRYAPVMNGALASLAFVLLLTTIFTVQDPATLTRPSHEVVASSVASSEFTGQVADPPAQKALTAEILSSLAARSWRHLDPALDELKDSGAPEWIIDSCLQVSPDNEQRCVYGPTSATHHAVVMGDSMAISYLPALRSLLVPRGWDIQVLTLGNCNNATSVLLNGKPYTACDAHRSWAIHRVQELQPDLVVLSNVTNIDSIVPSTLVGSRLETWQRGLTRTLRILRKAVRKVVVLSPPPGSGSLQTCVTRLSRPDDCAAQVSKSWDLMRVAEESAAAAAEATYINTVKWYCAFGECPAVVGQIPVFFDGIHTTAMYCEHLKPAMTEAMQRLLSA